MPPNAFVWYLANPADSKVQSLSIQDTSKEASSPQSLHLDTSRDAREAERRVLSHFALTRGAGSAGCRARQPT